MEVTTFNDNDDDVHLAAYVNYWDYLAIALYFVIILAVGIWSSKISKRDSLDGYFLAGRKMHWLPVGASLFASNIGAEHFIGLSGSGANSGIAISAFEYNAMFILIFLGWYFMPIYLASNVSTMPEYLQKRFGGQRIRVYLSVLALILYIFTKISAGLYAGALFIKLLLNIENIYISICILLIISAFSAIGGGLTAVIWTDFVQMFLMTAGAIVLAIISIVKVGGYSQIAETFTQTGFPTDVKYQAFKNGCNGSLPNNTCVSCSEITPHYFNLFRPIDDQEIPWPGMIFGICVSAIWCWCTDQVIVQRALAARNLSHAKAGCLTAAMLKVLPMFVLVLPGMAARILWPNQIGCSDPDYCEKVCGSRSGCTNIAYPYLVIKLMPKGATGLMVSAIIAALMSSLTSIFNSASTIFTIDIYRRFRSSASDIEQIIVSRVFIVFLVIISVIWIPILEGSHNSQLFQYIQSVTAFLAPPVCAAYLLAVFWDRTTEPGIFWSLVIGLVIGLTRMILEFAIAAPICGSLEEDKRPSIITKVHYLYFAIILLLICLAIAIVISLLTPKIEEKYYYRLTYSTMLSEKVREDIDEKNGHSINETKTMSPLSINKWIALICFVQKDETNDSVVKIADEASIPSPEELAKVAANAAKDDPKYAHLVNLWAILIIGVGSFFWGYYA